MSDNWVYGTFLLIIISISICLGAHFAIAIWKNKAIKHGCAQYNHQTGDFEWKQKDK